MYKITIENLDTHEITQGTYVGYIFGGELEDTVEYEYGNIAVHTGCYLTDIIKKDMLNNDEEN